MESTNGTFSRKRPSKVILVSVIVLLLILGIFSSYILLTLKSPATAQNIKSDSCQVIGYGPAPMITSRNASLGKSPSYDEQWLMGLYSNVTFISYNVTLTKQNDSYGSWPIYLVNALTNNNFWYQLGIDGGWQGQTGPNASFEVWTPSGIFARGGIGLSNVMHNADTVLLSINLTKDQVLMNIRDWNTSASGSAMLPVMGSTIFVGSKTPQPFFTGPMTEWYHSSPSFCNNGDLVSYSTDLSQARNPGWLCIDQWNFTKLPATINATNVGSKYVMFNGCETLPPQSSNVTNFNIDGNSESVNASEFVTP